MTNPSLLAQLTRVPLVRPCDEPWDEMIGDDRVRHCSRCARHVHDLSEMSALEAEIRLLNTGEQSPCIRYARRGDGSIVHAPALPTVEARRSRPIAAAAALTVTLAASGAHGKEPAKKPAAEAPANAPAQCIAYVTQEELAGIERHAARPDAQPSPPPEPVRLGGEPPMIEHQPAFGTLTVKSKTAREVRIVGIKLRTPIAAYRLTPGKFVAEVREPDGTIRNLPFQINADRTTVLDLDRKPEPARTPSK
jgi:hypothetical protein